MWDAITDFADKHPIGFYGGLALAYLSVMIALLERSIMARLDAIEARLNNIIQRMNLKDH
jgi:hypothetical protein